jgi:membrane-bound lytic murein transglycosylase D
MHIALRLLPAVLAFGFAVAGASETAPGSSDSQSPAAAAPAAAIAAPSALDASDIPLDVILEYMPELAPADSTTTRRTPLVASPSIDLWQRIRAGFRMPDLDTRLADQRTRWYAEQVDYFARMTQRSSRYLYFIVAEIERRGMPTELALLPFVESAFQAEAVSSAKAAGLWQFMCIIIKPVRAR